MKPVVLAEETTFRDHIRSLTSLLLDFDGTLVDYLENERLALRQLLTDLQVDPDRIDEIIVRYKEINQGLWEQYERKEVKVEFLSVDRFRRVCDEFDIEADPVEMNRVYLEYFASKVKPYPGLRQQLIGFQQKYQNIKMAILTNGTDLVQHSRARNSGFYDMMHSLVSSDKVGHAKPSPKIFDHLFAVTGFDPKTSLMVGDSLTSDIKGAQDYGLHSVLIHENMKYGVPQFDGVRPSIVVDSLSSLLHFLDDELQKE